MTSVMYSSGGIEINPRQIALQQVNAHDPFSTDTKFNQILGAMGTASSMAMPMAGAAFQKFGGANSMGAAITSTLLSGFATSGGTTTPGFDPTMSTKSLAVNTSSGGVSYGVGKNLSLPSAPPGYPGSSSSSSSFGAPPGFPSSTSSTGQLGGLSGGQDVSQFDSQINRMMNNILLFLAVQTKVQNVSQTTQLMSNIYKADSDAKLNAVRNVRS